jgi:IclR family acetate operon transcriptional repressor
MKQRSTKRNDLASGTQAVDRALAVLLALGEPRPAPGLTELSVELGLHKTTVFRMLGALERTGFVMRDVDRQGYRLGPTLLRLGAQARRATGLHDAAHPTLEAIAAETGETATLEVLVGDEMLIVDEVRGHFLVGSRPEVGTRWPAHATSTGKVLLAAARADAATATRAAQEPRARLARLGPNTITSRAVLARELAEVRRNGYAVCREEVEAGFVAVGAPVRNADGLVIAAISIGGPTARLTVARTMQLASLVRQAADRISQRLGMPDAADAVQQEEPRRPMRARMSRSGSPQSVIAP